MSSLIVEVSKILDVTKHPNADRLDIAQIRGFNCIVEKDQYKKDDLVIFIPPDAVIPDNIITKYDLTYLKSGNRIKTVKLRGVVSEGLILPNEEGLAEGTDVAEVLGITKWEPPIPKYQSNLGHTRKCGNYESNPWFCRYTNIEDIHNYINVFKDGDMVRVMEKIHGTNSRFGWLPRRIKSSLVNHILKFFGLLKTEEFCIGTHRTQLSDVKETPYYTKNVYSKVAQRWRSILPQGYIVFGEIFGPGIQDLTYGLTEIDFVCFDVYSFENRAYLAYEELDEFCTKYKLPLAPILYIGPYHKGLEEELGQGNSILCPSQIKEGVVITDLYEAPNKQTFSRRILKYRSPAYLTRNGGTEYQ